MIYDLNRIATEGSAQDLVTENWNMTVIATTKCNPNGPAHNIERNTKDLTICALKYIAF
jgi:hypothetical protein